MPHLIFVERVGLIPVFEIASAFTVTFRAHKLGVSKRFVVWFGGEGLVCSGHAKQHDGMGHSSNSHSNFLSVSHYSNDSALSDALIIGLKIICTRLFLPNVLFSFFGMTYLSLISFLGEIWKGERL